MNKEENSVLENYSSIMYSNDEDPHLRTGDVVVLELEDFKKIARHESMISLFEQYDKDPHYQRHFWAILNKSCDMVYDEKKEKALQK